MSVDRFKFISPGVFVNEIDNTGRSATPADIGPVLIGRSEKGPILRPTRVKDFADFITPLSHMFAWAANLRRWPPRMMPAR